MEKSEDLKTKNIIVTGSSKGLGLEISEHLLQSNEYKIIGISRTCSKEFKSLIKNFPNRVFHEAFDLKEFDMIKGLISKIRKEHGIAYGLINNAALGYDGILGTMHEKEIKELIGVNIISPILITKYVSRLMLTKREGRIINIGSIIGKTGFNGLSVYASSKSAMEGFTKSLAREVGKTNVTVNLICPGYMETEMTSGISDKNLERIKKRSPLGRLAKTKDVAEMVEYLLSTKGNNITGSSFVIDAGNIA